jgi:hypothetical protein
MEPDGSLHVYKSAWLVPIPRQISLVYTPCTPFKFYLILQKISGSHSGGYGEFYVLD